MKKNLFLIPVILCLLFCGCATMGPGSRLILVPTSTEIAWGEQITAETIAEYGEYTGPEVNGYVRSLGEKVVAVCDRKDIDYHFYVLDDPLINAFAAPGGYIFVTTGILQFFDNEAQLVAVLGHEVGHVAGRHSMAALQNQIGYELLIALLLPDSAGSEEMQMVLGIGVGLLSLKHSRKQEYEADNLGTKYTFKSGYDPMQMAVFLDRLAQMEKGGHPPEFLSTHPLSSKRKKEVRDFANELTKDHPGNWDNGRDRYSRIKTLIGGGG